MNIFITGISGLIGTALSKHFIKCGHKVYGLSRNPSRASRHLPEDVKVFSELPSDADLLFDVIINLQGEGIANKRWSESRKQVLRSSRIEFTKVLASWVSQLKHAPTHFISASAVGYYGAQQEAAVVETTKPKDEFTHHLCNDWENAARSVTCCTHHAIIRLGVVLSEHGGFLEKMRLPFKFGLGATLGSGQQYLSWIHINDVVSAIQHLLEKKLSGEYNFSAPAPVTNKVFTDAFARSQGRRARLFIPAKILELGLGEMSRLLLTGQRALPENLKQNGYTFLYPKIEGALAQTEA